MLIAFNELLFWGKLTPGTIEQLPTGIQIWRPIVNEEIRLLLVLNGRFPSMAPHTSIQVSDYIGGEHLCQVDHQGEGWSCRTMAAEHRDASEPLELSPEPDLGDQSSTT